uniref:Outer arm dynein light chain 1 protein n=1 Tax=Zea mays TaxID=4577 RepID=B6SLR5_MAIZE|nr:hypothetical protein [Zea mays]|eukprot:NP_001142655.1 uncharacterized LOC100274941 [Zea mays]
MLILSKNNISIIERLRELTRLRLLDINYNRISRIGHGAEDARKILNNYGTCPILSMKVGAITQMVNKLGLCKWSTLPKLYLDVLESNAGKAMP